MWDTLTWNIVVMLVGLPMFLTVLFLFTQYCHFQSNPRGRQTNTVGADVQVDHVRSHHVLIIAEDEQLWRRRSLVLGLRDEVIDYSCPKFLYSASTRFDEEDNACCSICLGEYEEGEMLRLLPECGHRFHLVCADTWLRINRSCPICRTFAVKKPVQTLPLNS